MTFAKGKVKISLTKRGANSASLFSLNFFDLRKIFFSLLKKGWKNFAKHDIIITLRGGVCLYPSNALLFACARSVYTSYAHVKIHTGLVLWLSRGVQHEAHDPQKR